MSVHQIGEHSENRLEQSRFEHLGDGLRVYCKQIFHAHQFQSRQFQGQLLQFCPDYPIRLVDVFEFDKSDRHAGQILLCYSGVVGLS
ncbi:unknown protein [Microcystis aeruginosa NIES-843]|uniref:Uncharacterized protein n=1 Tax=Microcystis aeruginosa (strain NIES-843 / IAM M-2473) TaxID=449447 RepID=B0JG56_MICAN|nr:unknown protein [Microcystis aeruginosa NIES-843]